MVMVAAAVGVDEPLGATFVGGIGMTDGLSRLLGRRRRIRGAMRMGA